jgi:hypothetical protein
MEQGCQQQLEFEGDRTFNSITCWKARTVRLLSVVLLACHN